MEDKIIQMTENLLQVCQLKEDLDNKEYWIQKASRETDFVPAEGDWIFTEVTLSKIEISVHHKDYGGTKYWVNGHWFNNPFNYNYPSYEEMLAEMRAL